MQTRMWESGCWSLHPHPEEHTSSRRLPQTQGCSQRYTRQIEVRSEAVPVNRMATILQSSVLQCENHLAVVIMQGNNIERLGMHES